MKLDSFSIRLDEQLLADLHARIQHARWPEPSPGNPWEQGTEGSYLKALLDYWADGFDWRAQESYLNGFHHFRAEVDGVRIHFVHERSRAEGGIPLILTHGWPSAFTEMLPLVPLLTNPRGHGIDGPAFDVVIPSLPGYGFSERPARTGVTYRYTAALWHKLMQGLGYHRYAAGGGDFGAGVATFMALEDPAPLVGLHLSGLEIPPYTGPGSRPMSKAELDYREVSQRWWESEGGYKEIQSTKPQTLAYGLNDSPVGLAAWILEKWRSWSDCGGNLDDWFPRDFLLTVLTIYWATETITTSMRDYFDNRWYGDSLTARDFIEVPTAIVIPRQFISEGEPPREWAERLYKIRRWTSMTSGGHFTAAEVPEFLARDIATFFRDLSGIR